MVWCMDCVPHIVYIACALVRIRQFGSNRGNVNWSSVPVGQKDDRGNITGSSPHGIHAIFVLVRHRRVSSRQSIHPSQAGGVGVGTNKRSGKR